MKFESLNKKKFNPLPEVTMNKIKGGQLSHTRKSVKGSYPSSPESYDVKKDSSVDSFQ